MNDDDKFIWNQVEKIFDWVMIKNLDKDNPLSLMKMIVKNFFNWV